MEPSSTTMTSRSTPSGSGAVSARLKIGAIYSSSLKSGTRIDRRVAGTRGIVSASITEGADQRRKFALPKNEDGEFELILANRQLLSVFFIVVILLGVFFTMGYIVGRNSGTVTAELTPVPGVDARLPAAEAPARAPEPAPAPPTPRRLRLSSLRLQRQWPSANLSRPSASLKAEARAVAGSRPAPDRPICNSPRPAGARPTSWWMFSARKGSGRWRRKSTKSPERSACWWGRSPTPLPIRCARTCRRGVPGQRGYSPDVLVNLVLALVSAFTAGSVVPLVSNPVWLAPAALAPILDRLRA